MTDTATTPIEPATTDQDLRALVKPDPHKSGRAFWRLIPSERPIWAIIMHLLTFVGCDDPTEATDDQIRQTADDYAISEAEVRTAIAYYAKNKKYIDAWLTINFDTGEDV